MNRSVRTHIWVVLDLVSSAGEIRLFSSSGIGALGTKGIPFGEKILCMKYGLDDRFLMLFSQVKNSRALSPYLQDIVKNALEDTVIAMAFRDGCFCSLG